jgi:hypothetical protein
MDCVVVCPPRQFVSHRFSMRQRSSTSLQQSMHRLGKQTFDNVFSISDTFMITAHGPTLMMRTLGLFQNGRS